MMRQVFYPCATTSAHIRLTYIGLALKFVLDINTLAYLCPVKVTKKKSFSLDFVVEAITSGIFKWTEPNFDNNNYSRNLQIFIIR
jgi:hypothetical protein